MCASGDHQKLFHLPPLYRYIFPIKGIRSVRPLSDSIKTQEIEKSLKDHDKAIADIQVTLAALMKQQEQSIKQQEQMLKHAQNQSGSGSHSDGGSVSFSSFSGDLPDPKTNRPMRIGKVEFPRFSGVDVVAWIYRCEHFFAIDDKPDNMKLRYALIHLEGDAVQWHRAFMKTRRATVAELPWEIYVRAISSRFSYAMFEDLHDYNTTFDALLNKKNEKVEIDYIPVVGSIRTRDLMPTYRQLDHIMTKIFFTAIDEAKKADFVLHNTVHEIESDTLSVLNNYEPNYAIQILNHLFCVVLFAIFLVFLIENACYSESS
ncbi:hypothetical protein OROMI_009942 [Orobanche minor]